MVHDDIRSRAASEKGFMIRLFFDELKERYNEIRNGQTECQGENDSQMLIDRVVKLLDISYLSRTEGLLALEERVYSDSEGNTFDDFLEKMILLVVDGTDAGIVEEIGLFEIVARGNKGYSGICDLMTLVGMLSVQAGENPRIVEERLLAMIPAIGDLREKVKESLGNKPGKITLTPFASSKEITYEELLDSLKSKDDPGAKRGQVIHKEDAQDMMGKLLFYALRSLDSRSIQRLLRDIANSDLGIAMKGMPDDIRYIIFSNLSERLALMIYEDMEYMGPVRMVDVEEACTKIYLSLINLINSREISLNGDELLSKIAEILEIEYASTHSDEYELKQDELQALFEGYLSRNGLVLS